MIDHGEALLAKIRHISLQRNVKQGSTELERVVKEAVQAVWADLHLDRRRTTGKQVMRITWSRVCELARARGPDKRGATCVAAKWYREDLARVESQRLKLTWMPEDRDSMIQLSHEGWMHTIKISKSGEIDKEQGVTGEKPTAAVGEKKGKEACEASKLRMSARILPEGEGGYNRMEMGVIRMKSLNKIYSHILRYACICFPGGRMKRRFLS